MIVKRKLFSKGTLTPEEKRKRRYERAADQLDESRGKVAIANGIRAGYQEGTKEEKGEKKNKLNRHSAWALPAIANGTVVGGETAATRQGLKSLKKAGASAKYLKKANKRLGAALGTYATLGAVPILAGEASYRVGKLAGKLNARKNKKEKSPKKED